MHDAQNVVEIEPHLNTLVFYWMDLRNPIQVLPTLGKRYLSKVIKCSEIERVLRLRVRGGGVGCGCWPGCGCRVRQP